MLRGMKSAVRSVVMNTVLRPPNVRHCSQTIYEALLGCCRLWEASADPRWKQRAEQVLDILLVIQRPDGGFDIGYEFNFGRLHRKGDSTSPELVGLIALCEYGRLFGHERVADAATRAAEWIRVNALDLGDGEVAVPYSPYTIRTVMVYNGTSFACAALGRYLGQFGGDQELHRLYQGMVRYLDRVMSQAEGLSGRFWYYSDQSRDDLDDAQRSKIDYYHQMQQVEVHSLAQQVSPLPAQLDFIRDAADHIVSLAERHPVLPYTNDTRYFKDHIHLWGLSSVVPGMLEAAVVLPERSETYRAVAEKVTRWVLAHAWKGQAFADVLDKNGAAVGTGLYMVRSDAWVFNAMAAASKHLGDGPWQGVADPCFKTMEASDFSGPESHASCLRRRTIFQILQLAKGRAGTRKPNSGQS